MKKPYRTTRRDFTAAKGYLYWYVAASIKHRKEFCMTPKQMRLYWDEINSPIEPPAGCRSQLIKHPTIPCWSTHLKRKMRKRKLTPRQRIARHSEF